MTGVGRLYLLSYLLNALWQVPLLFTAGWLAARMLRSAGPSAQHRAWVLTLLLQSVLPASFLLPIARIRTLFTWGVQERAGDPHVSILLTGGVGLHSSGWSGVAWTVGSILYGLACVWFAARFAWRTMEIGILRREARPFALAGPAADWWLRCSRHFGISHAALAVSTRVPGPVTLGLGGKLVLLPESLADALSPEDLRTVFAHEFAHMRRNDFAKNLAYELLSLPIAFHPFGWLTRQRVTETREMVCDRMAAEMTGPSAYARSLLYLTSLLVKGRQAGKAHAIGIFDTSTFERRLMHLHRNQKPLGAVPRIATLAACAVFAVCTCGLAVGLSLQPDQSSAAADSPSGKTPHTLSVKSDVMAKQLINKAVPHYPEEAKKAKIQGKVVLQAVIGKDGAIENLRVLSGPKELQQSALDAVRQWTYKPYLLNGDPISVKTEIHVIYSLAG